MKIDCIVTNGHEKEIRLNDAKNNADDSPEKIYYVVGGNLEILHISNLETVKVERIEQIYNLEILKRERKEDIKKCI